MLFDPRWMNVETQRMTCALPPETQDMKKKMLKGFLLVIDCKNFDTWPVGMVARCRTLTSKRGLECGKVYTRTPTFPATLKVKFDTSDFLFGQSF